MAIYKSDEKSAYDAKANLGVLPDGLQLGSNTKYMLQSVTAPAGGLLAADSVELIPLPKGTIVDPNKSFVVHDGVGAAAITLTFKNESGTNSTVVFNTTGTAVAKHEAVPAIVRPRTADVQGTATLTTSATLTAGKKALFYIALVTIS